MATENQVKARVKRWLDARDAWHYAPIQNGLGVHGIHDRIACVPIVVTPAMVGKTVGLFVSVEAKRPGRRNESDRGMSKHQAMNFHQINNAGGVSIVCDGEEDLMVLERRIRELIDG